MPGERGGGEERRGSFYWGGGRCREKREVTKYPTVFSDVKEEGERSKSKEKKKSTLPPDGGKKKCRRKGRKNRSLCFSNLRKKETQRDLKGKKDEVFLERKASTSEKRGRGLGGEVIHGHRRRTGKKTN